ncbi:myosin light chain 2 [Culex quinquefasciatus]|jgi:Ca2+-binding EF-hand superfamily protein|uniref:Myosin light chain 2 n=2 Tax=Culex quinquefasciatus TaxID=7176 RepID=B0XDR8_CULQU|nr:myosin regulatory light chain 2 [Culex quinquefasciatus]EDS45595.1 myosin light chain 2 [Culex quinquefasciatus]|eukprot:XP_001867790.1 myosin light chain 2 [Culex quinquefasciatus]
MSEKKEKKTKKKASSKDETPADTPAAETPAAPTPSDSGSQRGSTRGSSSRKAKKAPSSVFVLFSQKQIAEFKEAFQLMDNDKDGVIGKNDLRSTFDALGKLVSDKELDEMLGEASGPLNFTQLLTLFANRMSGGGTDDDDVVINAFKAFDNNGRIDGEKFRYALTHWGQDKFSEDEVDDAFDQMIVDDKGFIDTAALIAMLTGSEEGEEE